MKPSALAVLDELRARGAAGLTDWEASDALSQTRLAARVQDLEAEGYRIRSVPERTRTGKRITRYFLEGEPELRYGHPIGRTRSCPSCRGVHPVGTTCAIAVTTYPAGEAENVLREMAGGR